MEESDYLVIGWSGDRKASAALPLIHTDDTDRKSSNWQMAKAKPCRGLTRMGADQKASPFNHPFDFAQGRLRTRRNTKERIEVPATEVTSEHSLGW